MTLFPLIALIRYQPEPDFAVGQVALQRDPLTLATTVTVEPVVSLALAVVPVEVPVRRFTLEQAGTMAVVAGLGVDVGVGAAPWVWASPWDWGWAPTVQP